MLRAEENEILTRVGPGTLMGELLRRYWTPACLTAEIPEPGSPPARVRLLGENLVAFRDTRGRVGLVQENCPHRGASLYFGRNEDARAPLRLPRVGVRRGRQVRRHAERAGPVLREGPDEVLPGARVGRHRLGLPGPAGDHDPVQGLRHRRPRRRRVHRGEAADDLQLGAGDGGQPRHVAHLPPAPVRGDRRHPRRRLGQARLPVQRDVVEVLAARPRPPARSRRHLVRLPLRRHPHHAERQHPRAGHRLRPAVLDDGRQHPVHRRPRDVRAARRRELLALHHHPEAAAKPPRARRREPLLRRPVLDADHRQAGRDHPAAVHDGQRFPDVTRRPGGTATSAASPTSSARTSW